MIRLHKNLLMLLNVALLLAAAMGEEYGCLTLSHGATEELTLSSSTVESNCFLVPGTTSQEYRLTIRNSVYGRYTVSEGFLGFSWNSPVDGIYYCARGGTTITFEEYVEGATVTVQADLVEPLSFCFSDYISFDGYVPIAVPANGATTEVYWSSHGYYLHAAHFEYQVFGEDPVTMENGAQIEVSGYPGDDTYTDSTIEVTWDLNGLEKRFYAYLETNQTSWSIEEIRVYDVTEDWSYFLDPGISGDLGTCFTANNLTIANGEGSAIRFLNLTLATYLPWEDESSFLECINQTFTQGEPHACVDKTELFYVNAAVGNRDCAWLKANLDLFDYLCIFFNVAIACPDTCNVCDALYAHCV